MKKIVLALALISAIFISADAKWWIFGKSAAEVGLKYLQINNISADETGPKVKLFKEMLGTDGVLKIHGKAYAGKGALGSVRLSLDDKATWQDIKFSENGAFEYQFKPETGKTYILCLEITDTAGKTNNVDETRKELILSEETIQVKARAALDALFDAYNRENLASFMSYVSENFAGDKDILERAVKKDFDALSNIVTRYTLNNIAAGAQGRVFVSVTYNRMVFVNKTGVSNTDSGITEFVFDSKGGKLALFSMRRPLMFGLSDAQNVATGEVMGNNTVTELVLDETGNLGGGQTVTIDCRGTGTVMKYTFATEAQACDTSGGGADIWFYDWADNIGYGGVTRHKSMGKSLVMLTSAEVRNLSGYASAGSVTGISTGQAYCFELSASFYCVEPVTIPAPGNDIAKFKIKSF